MFVVLPLLEQLVARVNEFFGFAKKIENADAPGEEETDASVAKTEPHVNAPSLRKEEAPVVQGVDA